MRAVAVVQALALVSALGGCAPPAPSLYGSQCVCASASAFDPPGCQGAACSPEPEGISDAGAVLTPEGYALPRACSAAELSRGCRTAPSWAYGGGPLAPPELPA